MQCFCLNAWGWFVFWGAGDQAEQELTQVCEPRECVVVVHLVVVHVVPMQVALLLMPRTVCTRFELIYFHFRFILIGASWFQ